MTNPLRAFRSRTAGLADRVARLIMPDARRWQLRAELGFWRHWLASKGMEWPDDYARRLDANTPLQDHIAAHLDRFSDAVIQILDVGSGPITKIGKTHQRKELRLTAVDVLANDYNHLLAEFGVSPPVPTQYGDAQQLRRRFPDRRFDIAYAENSLDHTDDPVAAVREMLAVTRPDGIVILLHGENEGRKQGYEDLHKWDFRCEQGQFLIRGPGPDGPRHNLSEILVGEADVECSLREGEVLVTIKKHSARIARP